MEFEFSRVAQVDEFVLGFAGFLVVSLVTVWPFHRIN
jgi:uncharacterized membrane protein